MIVVSPVDVFVLVQEKAKLLFPSESEMAPVHVPEPDVLFGNKAFSVPLQFPEIAITPPSLQLEALMSKVIDVPDIRPLVMGIS